MTVTISIRPTAAIEDYIAIEQLQAEIWGGPASEVTPAHLLLTIAKEGGVVLLALDNDRPIGFAFGFLALTDDRRLKLASHQAGVLPQYQSRGVGYQLKLAQRQAALAKNLNLITWTFDPLQGRNARLNLRKLGAVCRTYIPNLYGEMADALNQGLPSDRFRVDWWLDSGHVTSRLASQFDEPDDSLRAWPVLNPANMSVRLPVPADTVTPPTTDFCLVEIPANINALKEATPELARQWRLQTRQIFTLAFETGYTAVDMLRREGRNYYLLQKNWNPA